MFSCDNKNVQIVKFIEVPVFVPQRRRLERGVVFLDAEPELKTKPTGPQRRTAEPSGPADVGPSACSVSTLQREWSHKIWVYRYRPVNVGCGCG